MRKKNLIELIHFYKLLFIYCPSIQFYVVLPQFFSSFTQRRHVFNKNNHKIELLLYGGKIQIQICRMISESPCTLHLYRIKFGEERYVGLKVEIASFYSSRQM